MLLLADFSCGQQKSSSQLQFSLTSAESYRFNGQPTEPHMLPNVCAFLGEAYASTGKTREAIVELKLGLASDGDGSVHYQLGRLYSKAGDKADAAVAAAQMKVLQQKRRHAAVIAVEDFHSSSLDDGPQHVSFQRDNFYKRFDSMGAHATLCFSFCDVRSSLHDFTLSSSAGVGCGQGFCS
jgi:hypothetical protein